MNLIRTWSATRWVHRLRPEGSGAPPEATEARERLVALGPAAIRPLFEAAARGQAPAAIVDVLVRLLDHGTLGRFIDALRSHEPALADVAAAALGRAPTYDPTLLLPLFSDARVSKARLEAILTGQLQRVSPGALVRALPDLNRDARASVFRLVERRADDSVVRDALQLSLTPDWWLRLHAVKLLAHCTSAPAVEGIQRLMGDENPAVRLEAVRAIGAMGAAQAIPAVCRRLRDADMRVQTTAIETLIALHDVAAVPHLIDHLKDDSEHVRRAAVEVLNQVVTTEAIKDLVTALRDSDWWVRVRAADALGTLGGPRVVDAILALVSDPDDFIRRYVIEILNTVPDPRAVDALIGALDDTDWWVRERAIDALAKSSDSRIVEPLLRVLERDPRAAALCVRALATVPDARAVDALCRLAEAEDDELRREVLVTLRAFAGADLPESWKDRVVQTLRRAGVTPGGTSVSSGARPAPASPEQGRAQASRQARESEAQTRGPAVPATYGGMLNFQRLEPDTVLVERFRVLRRIGGGGFGTVYLVEDQVVAEELVLKILSPHLSQDELMIRRFVQELRLTRRITHANVIRIHDLLDLQGAHAISMEYFAGRDLGALIRERGPMESPRALHLAAQIAEGLVAAHELGIIHRDIKPANLLVGEADLVKIVDFGLASVGQSTRSRLTQSGILVGTPEYISPEQITGHDVDGRTDLYSLGVVLYELLSGRQPFQGPNAVNVLFQHLEPDVPPLRTLVPGLPAELDELVMRCMSRFPDDRPANARELLGLLARAA